MEKFSDSLQKVCRVFRVFGKLSKFTNKILAVCNQKLCKLPANSVTFCNFLQTFCKL